MNMKITKTIKSAFICSAFMLFQPIINADIDQELKRNNSGLQEHSTNTYWKDALQRGINSEINPDDYVCSSPSEFDYWISDQVGQMNEADPSALGLLSWLSVLDWAPLAKLNFDNNASDEEIGVDGKYTRRQNKTFKNNKRFWNINSDDILLMGMHGSDIANDELMDTFIPAMFNYPQWVLDIILNSGRNIIVGGEVDLSVFGGPIYTAPGIPGGYDNPILTLNAFAFSAAGSGIPDKIIMGEGILQAITDIGLGYKEAPDYILSHEFAHHVQFEIGAFEPGPRTPEGTRRTELMADGFAAYFSSHSKGNTFQAKRMIDIMGSAYEVGDCGFSSTGHHGTHLQREKSVVWGEDVKKNAPNKGFIHSSESMLEMFDQALPTIIAPDAP